MTAAAQIPTMAQQICALAMAAAARRRAAYQVAQHMVPKADRAARAAQDRTALAAIANRRGLTVAQLARAHPELHEKTWSRRLVGLRHQGLIAIVENTNARRTGVMPNRYEITEPGRAMLVTLAAITAEPAGA